MEKTDNKFKLIFTGVFVFFIIAGLLAFSMFRSSNTANSVPTINIWGTVDQTIFNSFISKYNQERQNA